MGREEPGPFTTVWLRSKEPEEDFHQPAELIKHKNLHSSVNLPQTVLCVVDEITMIQEILSFSLLLEDVNINCVISHGS